jgi:hypothetical protein
MGKYEGQIYMESVSAVTATNSVEIGTRRIFNSEAYIYVYNGGSNAQIGPGLFAAVTATSGYTVTVSSTSGQFAVGVCKHATITTGTYGWLLTAGYVDGVFNGMASTALAGNEALQLAADGKVCKGETGPFIGQATKATASAGSANMYVSICGI